MSNPLDMSSLPAVLHECITCGQRFLSAWPWMLMDNDGRDHGPFCRRECLDTWAEHFDGGVCG